MMLPLLSGTTITTGCNTIIITTGMDRSASQRHLQPREASKSPTRRAIYLNQETSKRDLNTTFHSPYKDGKPNPQYFNPSFLSSHLFYPHEYLEPQQQQVVVTRNYVPNSNDLQKQALYRQRLRSQQASRSKTREKDKTREFNQQRQLNKKRILRLNQPQTLLQNQLGTLHNYREDYLQKQQRFQQLSRTIPEPESPAYLQKPGRRDQPKRSREQLRTAPSEQPRGAGRQQHVAVVRQLSELRRQLNISSREDQGRKMKRMVVRNGEEEREEEWQAQKEGELLGNILREQIKTNEVRRDRKWNY